MSKAKSSTIKAQGTAITVLSYKDEDFISLTDMPKAKDGDFFISDWLWTGTLRSFPALGIMAPTYRVEFYGAN